MRLGNAGTSCGQPVSKRKARMTRVSTSWERYFMLHRAVSSKKEVAKVIRAFGAKV